MALEAVLDRVKQGLHALGVTDIRRHGQDLVNLVSQSYREALQQFSESTALVGYAFRSHLMPIRGHGGEDLAKDVVRERPPDAASFLVISSACHGVEDFCGSGVQVALVRDVAWHAAVKAGGVAVLYAHALYPYGFLHWRRVTAENGDLNRNLHDFAQPLPANDGYEELADAIAPANTATPDHADLARTRQWWGPEVTSTYDGSSSSAVLRGLMWSGDVEECPQAESTGIALGHGTLPLMEVMDALRADVWLQQDLKRSAAHREAIRRQVRDAACIDTDLWKQQIVEQGLAAGFAALKGLSA